MSKASPAPKAAPAGGDSGAGSSAMSRLVPLAVVVLGLATAWKIVKTCSVKVHDKCITVVYETRRRTILCTSADREHRRRGLPRTTHFSPLIYISGLLIYSNTSLLVVPPSSFFGTFTLPKSVLKVPGETVNCAVEDVHVADGAVDMIVAISYTIPFEKLERYLSAVGPQPPNEVIGLAVADVARVRCAEVSVGILISKSRRENIFMEPFREHLASKLMSEAAVNVVAVDIENVELIEDA